MAAPHHENIVADKRIGGTYVSVPCEHIIADCSSVHAANTPHDVVRNHSSRTIEVDITTDIVLVNDSADRRCNHVDVSRIAIPQQEVAHIDVQCSSQIASHDSTAIAALVKEKIAADVGDTVHLTVSPSVSHTDNGEFLCYLHLVGNGEATFWQVDNTVVGGSFNSLGQCTVKMGGTIDTHHRYFLSHQRDCPRQGHQYNEKFLCHVLSGLELIVSEIVVYSLAFTRIFMLSLPEASVSLATCFATIYGTGASCLSLKPVPA